MNWYLKCIKENYANFNGRARRKEYWMFTLFNIIAVIAITIVAGILGSISDTLGSIMAIVYLIYVVAVFIPSIAVTVRRLHDTDKSAWWLLLILVPIASIVLIVFLCLDSTPADNQYGPNPKAL